MATFLSNALPAHHSFTIPQGTTWERVLEWQQPDGTPVNLTGYTGRMQVRDRQDQIVIELTTATGEITLGGTAGTVTLLLTDATTALLPTGIAMVYDLELESSGGEVTRLVQGNVGVDAEVTR